MISTSLYLCLLSFLSVTGREALARDGLVAALGVGYAYGINAG